MTYFVTAVQRGPSSSAPPLIRAACQCAPLCRSMRVCVSGCLSFQSAVSMELSCLGQTRGSVGREPWVNFKLLPPGRGKRPPSVCWARRLHRPCAGKSTIIFSPLGAFHYLGLNDVIPYCARATTDASFVGVISLS